MSGFVRNVIENIIDATPSDNMMWLMIGYMLGLLTALALWSLGYWSVRVIQLLLTAVMAGG